jgi:serine/threonine protein kinase/tetratricopeptide (TPR) repeat protein
MTAAADRHLLLGLLALQIGIINQSQLLHAFQAWTLDKARPLAEHLVMLGHLRPAQRLVVEAMAALHVEAHEGEVEKSLAAVPVGRSTRAGLADVGDPDIEATLGHVGSGRGSTEDGDADRTASYAVGTATSDGQRFRVLRPHARGGLGAVFIALDGELHREVALKQILDAHADDPHSRARFLLEAEVTGGLEHPGIVPVYGLGTDVDGRPYYAMRFIRGDTLKEAVDHFHGDEALKGDAGRRSLEMRRLLRRFVDACNAIEYAHSRGVLHRDIKPSNIIVGTHGETLVVDWGLAKATGWSDRDIDAVEKALVPSASSGRAETLPGSALGTPAYMSPEQAAGDLDRLGPRSDVYSLGATLYSLLTGRAPFAGDDVGALLRAVHRGDFPRPHAVNPSIDGALEAVCLKAMANRPEDRYATCGALAEDIERWAADEAVMAWTEPFTRRARRWGRRHRTAVTASVVALVAGVVGLSGVTAEQARSNAALARANGETRRALAETQKAQAETKAALEKSEESRKQAEAVGTFLVDTLGKPDPSQEGKDVKVADVLDRAAERIHQGFAGSKATEGALLDALGRSYFGLGLYPKAEATLGRARVVREAALGPEHPDTLRTCTYLASVYFYAGRYAEAAALFESTLKKQEATLGSNHIDTLESRGNVAAIHFVCGRYTEAIAMFEATYKVMAATLGPDHLSTLGNRSNLANTYVATGRYGEAIALLDETRKRLEAVVGPDHPDALYNSKVLAEAYRMASRDSEAIALLGSTLKRLEAKLGPDHPSTLESRNTLANTYLSAGRYAEAIATHEGTLRLNESKLGPDHPATLLSRNGLGVAYGSAGRYAEAIALHEATQKRLEAKHGPDHPRTLNGANNLAKAYLSAGRYAEAVGLFESALKRHEAALGSDHSETFGMRGNLARAYLAVGRAADARSLLEPALARFESKHGHNDPNTLGCRAVVAAIEEALGHWDEAEALWRENVAHQRAAKTHDGPRLASDLAGLGRNLLGVPPRLLRKYALRGLAPRFARQTVGFRLEPDFQPPARARIRRKG